MTYGPFYMAAEDFDDKDSTTTKHLSLTEGDYVEVTNKGTDGWWEGVKVTKEGRTGEPGWFPSSIVIQMDALFEGRAIGEAN